MKEKLYTIPLMDAMKANDECMFCFIDRDLEQNALEFVLGTSYMESDIRDLTDAAGFCKNHLKKMYDFGNAQGNALMIQTHYRKMMAELKKEIKNYQPVKAQTKEKLKHAIGMKDDVLLDPIAIYCRKRDVSCYVCDYTKGTFDRYVDTFFYLFKNEPEFVSLLKESKGMCLHHLGIVMEKMRLGLSEEKAQELREIIFELMESNLDRIYEDVTLFCNKFDYKYRDVPWGDAKDALPRSMQKLRGGYVADPPLKMSR